MRYFQPLQEALLPIEFCLSGRLSHTYLPLYFENKMLSKAQIWQKCCPMFCCTLRYPLWVARSKENAAYAVTAY